MYICLREMAIPFLFFIEDYEDLIDKKKVSNQNHKCGKI